MNPSANKTPATDPSQACSQGKNDSVGHVDENCQRTTRVSILKSKDDMGRLDLNWNSDGKSFLFACQLLPRRERKGYN